MRINDILVEFAPSGDGGGSGDYFQALASAWYNGTFDSGNLQKGIKSQQDVEQLLQRGIIGPDGVTRKYAIDYNSTFDGVVISSDDYYEHADHDETDSRTGKPFGPYDYMEFGDEELDEGLTEFAADDGNDGGEEDALHKYARMWWAGDEATQMQIERALAKMGWEIGEDEGGYDNGGVFVVRAGDINGNSYTSWSAEDLTEGVAEGSLTDTQQSYWDQVAKEKKNKERESLKAKKAEYEKTPIGKAEKYWDQVAKEKKNKERESLKAKKAEYEKTPIGKAEKYWGQKGVAEGDLNEKSISQAQFRTMAAAAHDPEFAKKVSIKQSVAREFNRADKDQDYKDLPKKATEGAPVTTTPGSIEPGGAVDNFKQQMANNTERDMAEGNRKPEPPEADYGDDYQDMVKRVKKLAGLGPLKTQYDPAKRVYRNMPTAVQAKK